MKQSKQPSNFLRFLGYVRPYSGYIVLAAFGGCVKFLVPLAVPKILQHLIDGVFANPDLTAAGKSRLVFLYLGGLGAVFLFFWAPLTYVRHYYAGKAGNRSVFDLRVDLYYRVLRMSASFFNRHKSGEIVSRLINDIALAQNLVGTALTNVWMDAAAITVVLVIIFNMHVKMSLVALAVFPVYLYFFRKLGREVRASSYEVQKETAVLSGSVSERISGSQVVHAFTKELSERKHFYRDSRSLYARTMRTVYFQSLNMAISGVLTQLAPLLVIAYGGHLVITREITIGQLVAFMLYLNPLYIPLQRFSELNAIFANSMAALDRIFEILDEKPEVVDKPGAVILKSVEGRVEFDRVGFSYKPKEPVLSGVSFLVKPGQRVALVGPSGSGKSTLVSLLPRFYDVDSGRISIDGHDLRTIQVKSLRRHIGLVLQDPVLFSGSIRENILYGNPESGWEEMVAASRAANAYDFISELPEGFETDVGERGNFLSGGQKQRLTIARAFLKDPKILVLDEPTSALDAESEQLIKEALERLMVNRTTFIIAHRLSTVSNVDFILVLYRGRIVESGRHEELLRNRGLYHSLYNQQFGYLPPEAEESDNGKAGVAGMA